MAAPMNTCTKIEEMLLKYGEHCLSHQAVHNWVQKSSKGRTSIEDEHLVDWLVIAKPATLQRVEDIIRADRRVTIDTAATATGCSHPLLPYVLPTKTAQCHTVLSWYTYSEAPPSCDWSSVFSHAHTALHVTIKLDSAAN
jgi:hypothetical protein